MVCLWLCHFLSLLLRYILGRLDFHSCPINAKNEPRHYQIDTLKTGSSTRFSHSFTRKLGKSNIAAIDPPFAKAHRTACSLKPDGYPRQIELTKGGRNIRIHMIANIEQKPVDFSLSPRQASDYRVGKELVKKNLHRLKIVDR